MVCPRCHEGAFFVAHPYNLKRVGDLYEHCPECGLKYEKEIGFYYGAMYVSYALGVALFVTCWVIFNLFFPDASTALQITTISVISLAAGPYFYALSKIIWANLFFGYDKDAIRNFRLHH
ncbi:MAG TPA: DUF983 domain-containing protein [Fluviicola sp.]|nr:DUF983 domain-containing protein [Fluviicola sp.]